MKRLEALSTYFKGGQSESETKIRNDIFVIPNDIEDITDFNLSNYKIVIGPKGSGKSMLVDYLSQHYLKSNKIAIVIRPKELNLEIINEKSIVSEKIKEAKNQIYELISKKIGEGIDVALSENEKVFEKINKDSKPPSVAMKIGNFLKNLLPNDYKKLVDSFKELLNVDAAKYELDEEITNYLKENDDKLILFVDDLDKAAEETKIKFEYSTSWSILEASVEVANEIDSSSVLITVRTDIWHLMTKVKKLGSTIFDKIGKPYNLFVNERWISQVFRKRIVLCYRRIGKENRPTYEYDYFFEPSTINFYGKNDISRSWEQWVAKNTRNRPRDMIILMQKLIAETKKLNNKDMDSKISGTALHNILEPYAKERVEFIRQEYIQIFPQIDKVIYRIKQTRYDFKEIREFLESVCGIGLSIDGLRIRSHDEQDRFKILKLLHMASVLNPRIDYPDGTYNHILFEEDNEYIDPENISKLQKCIFQLHPTFHSLVVKPKI